MLFEFEFKLGMMLSLAFFESTTQSYFFFKSNFFNKKTPRFFESKPSPVQRTSVAKKVPLLLGHGVREKIGVEGGGGETSFSPQNFKSGKRVRREGRKKVFLPFRCLSLTLRITMGGSNQIVRLAPPNFFPLLPTTTGTSCKFKASYLKFIGYCATLFKVGGCRDTKF